MVLGYEAENPPYQEPYSPGPYSPMQSPPPPNATAGSFPPENYYPSTNAFPPPPNAGLAPAPNYNPADYSAPPGIQAQQIHPDYGYSPQPGYTPPQGVYSPNPADPYGGAAPGKTRRADENVSAEPFLNTTNTAPVTEHRNVEEGG